MDSPSQSIEDESLASFRPKFLRVLLSCYGFSGNGRFYPWIFFMVAFTCRCHQLVSEMTNGHNTTIFKLVLFCSFAIESSGLFLTIYHRHTTRQLTDSIFSQVRHLDHCVLKKFESTIFILLLSLYIGSFILISANASSSWRLDYPLVARVPGLSILFKISLFIFRAMITLSILSMYVNCSLYVLTFLALSLNRLHNIQEMKQLVPHNIQRIMRDLMKMDHELNHFEAHSSLPIFMMIGAYFLEISLFLYRLVTYTSPSFVFHIGSIAWTVIHTLFIIYFISAVSVYQEKVKHAGLELADRFFIHASPPSQYNIAFVMAERVKCVTGQSITAWNIVNIDRQLIVAIFSSFLTIAVLLVQMDNGALRANGHPALP